MRNEREVAALASSQSEDTMEANAFNQLVTQFLGRGLPNRLADRIVFADLSAEAQGFLVRMLGLMQRAGHPATEFTSLLMAILADMIPNMLPSAWGGRIPPLTMPGRHRNLDALVDQSRPATADRPLFIDIGCGFPPVTTADSATRLPHWRIVGIDREFARYVVYDSEGDYACFDRHGGFQYFQAPMDSRGRALYANPKRTRLRFEKIFADLQPLLQRTDETASEVVKKDDAKLIQNHIRDFETDNLAFIESEFDSLQMPPARMIRCMNVLIYYTPQQRKKKLVSLGKLLADGGKLIAGTNGNNIQARYAVYRKRTNQATQVEFAFSLDNLRSLGVMPWFTIHENDPEAGLLAELIGRVRADDDFWPAFTSRVDALLEQYGLCRRAEDGFMHVLCSEVPLATLMDKMKRLWQQVVREGYAQGVVKSLKYSGYEAWINPVGDITVRPPEGAFPVF